MNIYSYKNPPIDSYVYAYLREDLTPYYIGKGKGSRAWKVHARQNGTNLLPKNKTRIQIFAHRLSDAEACELEKKLILYFGRKDLGTGILRNLTAGGDGTSGRVVSEITKQKKSESLKGKKIGPHSSERRINISKSRRGQPAANKGKPMPPGQNNKLNYNVVCPSCSKEGNLGAMKRWHFDNCKKL